MSSIFTYSLWLKHIGCLYHNNTLRTFEELREPYNLQRKDFWSLETVCPGLARQAPGSLPNILYALN